MSSLNINENDFQKEVLESPIPVLIDFWADWCGPCKMVSPVVEAVAEELADTLKVVKIDVDKNPSLASQYGIRGIPALCIFSEGKMLKMKSGACNKAQLLSFIAAELDEK